MFFIDSATPRHQPVDLAPGSELMSRNDDPGSGLSWRKLSNGRDYRIVRSIGSPAISNAV